MTKETRMTKPEQAGDFVFVLRHSFVILVSLFVILL